MHRSIRRRGFNLIEAAIVLAVVGLVIGGIWAAASAVTNHMKWVNTQKGWLYYTELLLRNFNGKTQWPTTRLDAEAFLITFPLPAGWSISSGHPIDPFGQMLYAQVQFDTQTFAMGYSWQTVTPFLCSRLPGLFNLIGQSHTLGFSTVTCYGTGAYFALPAG